MKKLLFGTILLASLLVLPFTTMARVDVSINIALPPPIVFPAPPMVIVIPDTHVYVDPDIDIDLFFWNGWWWRLWEGRWYRSSYYDRGWRYYRNVPSFYFDVDPGWRRYYREHDWHGHRWDFERIPQRRLQQNWKSWQNNRRWERQGTWGVQNYQPRPRQQRQELRQQRQQEYQRKPEIQRQRQQQQELRERSQQQRQRSQERIPQPRQQSQDRVQTPRQQPQERVQQRQHSQPLEKPERGERERPDRR